MRSLGMMLGAWLCLSAYPCEAGTRLHDLLISSEAGSASASELSEPTSTVLDMALPRPSLLAPSFALSLVPELVLPAVEPTHALREAILPPHLVMVGRLRGAMLDRCRSRMRNLALIGHGASTDGRPDTCHLLSYVGLTKYRERAIRRRGAVRTRFLPTRIEEMPGLPRFAAGGVAPVVMAQTLAVPHASGPGRSASAPPPGGGGGGGGGGGAKSESSETSPVPGSPNGAKSLEMKGPAERQQLGRQ